MNMTMITTPLTNRMDDGHADFYTLKLALAFLEIWVPLCVKRAHPTIKERTKSETKEDEDEGEGRRTFRSEWLLFLVR